jgi:hypothetical protein
MARGTGDTDQQLNALFEEYRALYSLVVFRMTALDRRAPVTAGAFAATIIGLTALPADTRVMVLILVPIGLVWLIRTTVNHARSFEDVLRRIEYIEQSVNVLTGKNVLGFQSLHPSRGRRVGGRTGYESIIAVIGSIHLVLIAAGYQMHELVHLPLAAELLYFAMLAAVSAVAIRETMMLSHYHYAASIDRA